MRKALDRRMVTTGTIVEKLLHNGNNVKEESHPKHVSNPYLLSTLSKKKEALIQRKVTPMLMDKAMKTPHTGNFHLIKQF